MRLLKNAIAYGATLALGIGAGYGLFSDHEYDVVKANCRLYVEDKETGRYGEVDTDFDVNPKYLQEVYVGDCRERSLAERLDDALRELVR